MSNAGKDKSGLVQVFTKKIRLRNGKVLYASAYGLQAFSFWAKPRSK